MEVLGIVSLVLGILSIIGSYWYVGVFLSLIGLVLGAVSVSDSLSSGKLISAMGILTSILGIVMTAYFVASDLDSEKLVVQADKFTKGKEQAAERDDFMRFHKDVAVVEETDGENVEEETEDRQKTEQEEEITPYWISDSTEEGQKTDSEDDSLEIQPEEENRESEEEQEEIAERASDSNEYRVGETWTVPGQFKFTINSVRETKDRNEWEEKNPAAVYVIDYTYENLGYEGAILDGLYIEPSNHSIVDSAGEVGYGYYVDGLNNPQEAPKGAHCNAQDSIGVNHSGDFKIYIEEYCADGDNGFKNESAVFNIHI